MALAVALILLVLGTILFHFLSPWWFTPIASNWKMMDDTVNITFVVTGIVFVAVNLFMAWALLLYRHRKGRRAEYSPENKRLEWWLTIVTGVGVTAMLVPGLFVWSRFVNVPSDATVVEVVGQQWQWSFRLPGKDGKLGTSDTRDVTAENPLGVIAKDPNGQDDVVVEAADLHLPVGKPVKMLLRSIDVLHDFYVPEFRAKMDMIPGSVTYFWFTPTKTGTFQVLCAELCGQGHPMMHGIVMVDTQEDYVAWLDQQQTFAQLSGPQQTGSAEQAPGNATVSALEIAAKLETVGSR